MSPNKVQMERIISFIPIFKQYLQAENREADLRERQEWAELYSRLLSPASLSLMNELEFGHISSSLWASLMWGNKDCLVERLLEDNNLHE
jgi:hypothetical protein